MLVFFKPGSETAESALVIADLLNQKYGTRAVVPLAVWGTVAAGEKERDQRKLAVPIYDGAQAETAYGIESVPRFRGGRRRGAGEVDVRRGGRRNRLFRPAAGWTAWLPPNLRTRQPE